MFSHRNSRLGSITTGRFAISRRECRGRRAGAVRAGAIHLKDAGRLRMGEVRRREMVVGRHPAMGAARRRNDVPIEVNPRNDIATSTDS